jgi:hypothetical protein
MVFMCSDYKTRVIRIMMCQDLESFAESYLEPEGFTS